MEKRDSTLYFQEEKPSVLETLRGILAKKGAGTQAELRDELEKVGLEVTQSTISRVLRKLGAVKSFAENGATSYQLPLNPLVTTSVDSSITDLILDIKSNENLIVIHTSPGSASLIARHLDRLSSKEVLGTLAGDDTVFVAPSSIRNITGVTTFLRRLFGFTKEN
ncbi:MAG: arginine repressor [Bdellovibrionales bacterium]|nr:arginine repressor [Bdellovibrionales bacterium]